MRLNSSALNSRILNGARRVPVFATAEVIAGLSAELVPLRTTHLSGEAVARLNGDLYASAHRYLVVDSILPVRAVLAGSVTRRGTGAVRVNVVTSLYYMRSVRGFGAAELFIGARGDVGVVFIDGSAAIHPFITAADGARKQRGAGATSIALDASMGASAVRRGAASQTGTASISATLDAAHVTTAGVRYITGSGAAIMAASGVDAGMRRQTLLGSMDFSIDAAGSARIQRPSLAGASVFSISADLSLGTQRFFKGNAALVDVGMSLDAQVHVRGDGGCQIALVADAVGYAYRRSVEGDAVARLDAALNAQRFKIGSGDLLLPVQVIATGARKPALAGRASVPLAMADFAPVAIRGARGDITPTVVAHLDAETLVPFSGAAGLLMAAEMEGYRTRFDLGGSAQTSMLINGQWVRIRAMQAEAHILDESLLQLDGTAIRVPNSDSIIVLFSASDAYLNPAGDDVDEQQFYRPEDPREFARPEDVREFLR